MNTEQQERLERRVKELEEKLNLQSNATAQATTQLNALSKERNGFDSQLSKKDVEIANLKKQVESYYSIICRLKELEYTISTAQKDKNALLQKVATM